MSELEDIQREEAQLLDDDPKVEVAILGRQIELWVEEDPIGRYVIERARTELEEVKEALLTCRDAAKIQDLQSQAAVCNRIRQWLGEAVQAGRAAAIVLQQERDSQHAD